VDGLFSENAVSRNAQAWVEKTPLNLFRIEFLFEMFPDALFINCVRDPRGVLDSFMRKQWLSGSLQDGAECLVSYYEYIAKKRQFGLEKAGQYYEVRLEELVQTLSASWKNCWHLCRPRPFLKEEFLRW